MPLTNPWTAWSDPRASGAGPVPRLRVDLAAVAARQRAAAAEVAALVDELVDELARLWVLLVTTRRAYADLVAAGRATLAAHSDGEDDPLCYLRDELPDPPPEHPHPRARGWGWGR